MSQAIIKSSDDGARQIKSRERVAKHGEVFTNPREVNAMLDLVRDETERIDSRFLEPACDNGNFLAAILERKLAVVERRYRTVRADYELNALIAVSSLYGIELLEDNAEECRERLLGIVAAHASRWYREEQDAGEREKQEVGKREEQNAASRSSAAPASRSSAYHAEVSPEVPAFLRSAAYIIRRNILCGDALTLCTADGRPVAFAEWSCIGNGMIKRRDFTLDMLLRNQPLQVPNLFSDLGDEAFIPTPFREFPPIHYLKLYEQDDTEQL